MGKSGLQKLLAVLLAGTIATSGASALAEKKGKTSTKPAITIEEEIKTPSIEDLCLPEECIAALNQFGIPIVNGNIMLQDIDAEQYSSYCAFLQSYLKKEGCEATVDEVIKFYTCNNITKIAHTRLAKELHEQRLVDDTPFYSSNGYNNLYKKLSAFNKSKAGEKLTSPIRLFSLFESDCKSRQGLYMIENYVYKFSQVKDKLKNEDQYIGDFGDIYNYLVGEKSNFNYSMAELSLDSQISQFAAASFSANFVMLSKGVLDYNLDGFTMTSFAGDTNVKIKEMYPAGNEWYLQEKVLTVK